MANAVIDLTGGWTQLNATAVTGGVTVQNLKPGAIEIARSDTSAPPDAGQSNGPSRWRLLQGDMVNGTLDEIWRGGSGAYVWARAQSGSGMAAIEWT